MITVKEHQSFPIEAIVLLPKHFHCLLTLLEHNADFSVRLRLIKTHATTQYEAALKIQRANSQSRQKRREGNLWQRRYWEHFIRNEKDLAIHCNYIPYNPVRHGLCERPQEWKYSNVHQFFTAVLFT